MIKRPLREVNIKTKFLILGFLLFVLSGVIIYFTREDATKSASRRPIASQDLKFRSNIAMSKEKQHDYTVFQEKEATIVKPQVQLPNKAYLPPNWVLAAEKKSQYIESYVYTNPKINNDQYPTVSLFIDTFPGTNTITLEDFSITRREQLNKYNFTPIPLFQGTTDKHLAFETQFEGENGMHSVILVVTVKDNKGISFLVDSLEKDAEEVKSDFEAILASYFLGEK